MPRQMLFLLALATIVAGCAGLASLGPRSVATMPAGTRFLGEVIYVASRDDMVSTGVYEVFLERGIPEAEIRDGSAGTVRINCCGGPDEERNSRIFHVPPGFEIGLGDVVEIRYGSSKAPPGAPRISRLTDIRQRAGQDLATCRWVPDCHGCWNRVIHCDGLEDEGWVRWGPMEWWVRLPEGQSPDDAETRITF
jgi:hypothetical protein